MESALKNRELRNLYRNPDIMAVIRISRIRWFSHVIKSEKDSTIRRASGEVNQKEDAFWEDQE